VGDLFTGGCSPPVRPHRQRSAPLVGKDGGAKEELLAEGYDMNDTQDERRDWIYADGGRVADAVRILATHTTLAEHVTIHDGDPLEVEVTDDIPFELWGSGTQALWRLACAIAYRVDTVSLYEVASRLDERNTVVASSAIATLFGTHQAATR
jgi:hypothetical protein